MFQDRCLLACLLLCVAGGGVVAQEPPKAPSHVPESSPAQAGFISPDWPAKWAEWAGQDGVALGFTTSNVKAYLEAQKASETAGSKEPFKGWLRSLSTASSPSVRAWALARRLEAGDLSIFPLYQQLMLDHVIGISKPQSGRTDKIIQDPPGLGSALVISKDAPFWKAFLELAGKGLDAPFDPSLYAVWCYGTAPGHRGVILEEAARVKPVVSALNPNPDPWNDPRFWIIVDWAMAWGNEGDFDAIAEALPNGPARAEFTKIKKHIQGLKGFWQPPVLEKGSGLGAALPGKGTVTGTEPPVQIKFDQMKIKRQPSAPHFPAEAKARRMTTVVTVEMIVGPDGIPLHSRLLPGPWLAFFGPTAYEYSLDWRFDPARVNGIAQTARFKLTMPFHLNR